VRAGLYQAARDLDLKDLFTFTLPEGARGSSPMESRTAISRLWNALRTYLRKSGFMGEYVVVPEEHKDGTAHLQVAANIEPWVRSFILMDLLDRGELTHPPVVAPSSRGVFTIELDLDRAIAALPSRRRSELYSSAIGKVEENLQRVWNQLGGGYIWYGRAQGKWTSKGWRSSTHRAAAYLAKYLAKAQAKAPSWDDLRYCTEDISFRRRGWHRFWPSRGAGRIIARYISPKTTGEYELVLPVFRPSGRIVFEPWTPALNSAICDGCDGHGVHEPWRDGSCHHELVTERHLGCFCRPPWATETWNELQDVLQVAGRRTGILWTPFNGQLVVPPVPRELEDAAPHGPYCDCSSCGSPWEDRSSREEPAPLPNLWIPGSLTDRGISQ